MQQAIRFLKHHEMEIYFTDISNTRPEDSIEIFEANRAKVAEGNYPEQSLYSLVDASGARFNTKLIQTIKNTVKSNGPYIRSTVVVGLSPLSRTIVNSIMHFTGRDMKLFDTVEEGKNHLYSQWQKHQLVAEEV